MHKVLLFASLSLIAFPAMAERLPCKELRDRVDTQLQAKGVLTYTLELVQAEVATPSINAASGVQASSKAAKGKLVGTCDGGTKRLIYTRGY